MMAVAIGCNSPALAGSKSNETNTREPSGNRSIASNAPCTAGVGVSGNVLPVMPTQMIGPATASAIIRKIQRRSMESSRERNVPWRALELCGLDAMSVALPEVAAVEPDQDLEACSSHADRNANHHGARAGVVEDTHDDAAEIFQAQPCHPRVVGGDP